MSINAQLNWERGTGPRASDRLQLSLPVNGASDTLGIKAIVHNLSETGLLLQTHASLAIGETFWIDLPETGQCRASVIWSDDTYFGCRFDKPLTRAALSAARLQSPGDSRGLLEVSEQGGSETFAERLARLRKERGFTQAELSRRTGVSKPSLWAWEAGKSMPRPQNIHALAHALTTSEQYLVDGEGEKNAPESADAQPDEMAGSDPANPLRRAILSSKERIAQIAGTSPDKVKLTIEF
ncbi:helix-turn-helix domain-containing protein [Croceibacterium aestuarii]|uniref:helix-turn-helix domain-containing protein n=1 Tax=Croceibacterium aestuarii TaxID=3064139 RepID=UPI00272E2DA4|nr:helix-turn-helix domain-containing protein [Croceibacterium sp. D39]